LLRGFRGEASAGRKWGMIKWKISLYQLQDLVRFRVNDFDSDVMTVFSNPSNGQINVRISKYFGKVDIK
jgi:hypothetical protein